MKVDLHLHDNKYSSDSHVSIAEIVEEARRKGLDGIALTNHESVEVKEEIEELVKKYNFPIFPGVEYLTKDGDIVAFGIDKLPEEQMTAQEFIDSVTKDIMNETVFVFSPKGDITELPQGATPLDFAFAIHTQIGCKCVGAKVNGKIVTLDYKLQNGDRVEIITSKNSKGPNKDWLDIVVTHGAKSKIKKVLKDLVRDQTIKNGRENLERELGKLGITLKEMEEDPIIKKHMEKNNITSLDEFYYHVGEKRSKIDIIIDKLRKKIEKDRKIENINIEELMEKKKDKEKSSSSKNDYGIIIDGVNNTLIRFARCCTPLPGDEIGGYVTKLTGITVHRRDCKNFQSMIAQDPTREIEVEWDSKVVEQKENKYKFTLNQNLILNRK